MNQTEDAQPNEIRHARKGNAAVPTIRSSQTFVGPQHRGRGSSRDNNSARGPRGRGTPYVRPHLREHSQGSTSTGLENAPAQERGTAMNRTSRRHGIMQPSGRGPVQRQYKSFKPGLLSIPASLDHVSRQPLQMPFTHRMHMGTGVVQPNASNSSTGFSESHAPSRCDISSEPAQMSFNIPSGSRCTNQGTTVDSEQAPFVPTSSVVGLEKVESEPRSHVQPTAPTSPLRVTHGDVREVSPILQRRSRFRSGVLRIQLPVRYTRLDADHSLGVQSSLEDDVEDVSMLATRSSSASGPESPRSPTRDCDNEIELKATSVHGAPGSSSKPDTFPSTAQPYIARVQMRREFHDKPRRLFVLPDQGTLSVTMRGSLDLVEQMPLRCTALRTTVAGEDSRQLVDDVCMVPSRSGAIVVLGRASDTEQLSLIQLRGRKVLDMGSFSRSRQGDKKGGISAVCSMIHPEMFATGGYDHVVNLWSLSDNGRPTSSTPLAIRHTSAIHSLLAIRDTSHKLLTGGADCNATVYDIASERTVNTLKLSNSVYHVHPAISHFCALLELGHREFQFEVRDYRLVPLTPVLRFGYPSPKVHGRFTKGAVQNDTFACGGSEKDGCVRLWDLRKPTEVMQTVSCFQGRKATQVVFGDTHMAVCSEDHQLALVRRTGELARDS